ncbi:MAG: flagellar export protein FliJ [Nitrospina sp.]|jgi:flagellar export protein FliJ|nr:flagellar export protein FliJ [Nitrospina sp.]MDG1844491.1 flagellar export protein FliJ [Nitrospinaceae bacterium]MBT4127854.1 flagellar export protein FliJ [Nitrospina sp.]MBT5257835.1 flagellar export protein FliJ [Nitrospina sp.]MBT5985413.1 flagellar export protein FliJ [Nitrospina sp.]|tara:strand:+ start:1447 stop:1881 length:435 start_codon:yes stop_codon:yes gene_type:complete
MKFRFEALLQIRKNKENILQKELGVILAHKQTQQNRQDFLKNTRKNEIVQINQRMNQDSNIDTHVLYDTFFKANYLQNNRQKQILSEINTRAEAKREELVGASQKSRIMEILKERDLNQHKNKLKKIETAEMDEIASNYWHLNS